VEPLSLLVIMSLAAYRVTRLVVSDTFPPVQRLRDWVVGPNEDKHAGTRLAWLDELLTCNWCASFWVSGVVVGVTEVFVAVPLPFLMWWSVSGLTAFVLHVEDTLYGWSNVNMKRAQQLDARRRTEPSQVPTQSSSSSGY
jgi:hypothetical protein